MQCSPSARCPRDARWVLGDRNFDSQNGGRFFTSSEVHVEGVFHTLSSSDIFFTWHMQGRFPLARAVTPHRTVVLKLTLTPGAPRRRSAGHRSFRAMRVLCTATAVLIGMTMISFCSV